VIPRGKQRHKTPYTLTQPTTDLSLAFATLARFLLACVVACWDSGVRSGTTGEGLVTAGEEVAFIITCFLVFCTGAWGVCVSRGMNRPKGRKVNSP
jgi:hypothetical protein